MAWYTDDKSVIKIPASHDYWAPVHSPGDSVPLSGIYICTGCKAEVTCNNTDPFPPQNHHQHPVSLGKIGWKLLVQTNTDGR